MARFKDLPVELLLQITIHLELLSDINALSQTDSSFHSIYDPLLYERIRIRASDQRGNSADSRLLGEGPLEWAAENGKHACASRLLRDEVPVWPRYDILPPIITAAKKGDLKMVEIFVDHDPAVINTLHLIDLKDEFYIGNPLTYAIAYRHDSVVEFLIKNGTPLRFPDEPHPSYSDESYIQPMDQAIKLCRNTFAAKLLLENGRERDDIWSPEYLTLAAQTSFDMFKVVMDAGLLPEFDGKDFWQGVLDKAIFSGDVRTVKALFEHGVRINMDATETWSPNSWGVGGPDNIFTKIGTARGSHSELTTFLLQQISLDDVVNGSSLHSVLCMASAAASIGDEKLLRDVLKTDWANKKPVIDQTQWLSWLEMLCFYSAVNLEHIPILKVLVEYGVPISWTETLTGSPPIIEAARMGKYEIVKYLFEKSGAPERDPNYRGHAYDAPDLLYWTLHKDTGLWNETQEQLDQRHKIVQFIMERVPHAKILHRHHNILQDCVNIRHEGILNTLEMHRCLRIDLEHDNRLYHEAIWKPNPQMTRRFLEAGFDPNYYHSGEHFSGEQEPGDLPLNLVGRESSFGGHTYSMVEYTAVVNLLLEYGADMEKRTPTSGLTPLFVLVSNPDNMFDFTPIATATAARVQFFLEKGADPFSSCNGDESLIEIAVRRGDLATLKVLLEFFDQQNVPFEKVRGSMEKAAGLTQSLKMKNVLSRWYWRKRNL